MDTGFNYRAMTAGSGGYYSYGRAALSGLKFVPRYDIVPTTEV